MKFSLAEDGAIAVEKFKKEKFDVILMDEMMPNMLGSEAIKVIRQLEKNENRKPAIIATITGLGLEADRTLAFAAGANDFLQKPVSIKQFDDLLVKFFAKN
jgi:CheY-like chemotaxis protein